MLLCHSLASWKTFWSSSATPKWTDVWTHALLPIFLRRARLQTGGRSAFNNSCRIHYISLALQTIRDLLGIVPSALWPYFCLFYQLIHCQTQTTTRQLKHKFESNLAFFFLFPIPLNVCSLHSNLIIFPSKWFTLKLKTWGEAWTCSTTCLF